MNFISKGVTYQNNGYIKIPKYESFIDRAPNDKNLWNTVERSSSTIPI